MHSSIRGPDPNLLIFLGYPQLSFPIHGLHHKVIEQNRIAQLFYGHRASSFHWPLVLWVTLATQVSEESLLFLYKKKNMHCKNIEHYSNMLASLGDACTSLLSQPSPYWWSPFLMGESVNAATIAVPSTGKKHLSHRRQQ